MNNPTETAPAIITPLGITGSITANNKAYDGTTAATLEARTLIGVLGGDDVTLIGGVCTFNSKDVTGATSVTATGLTLAGARAADYALSNSTETASASITPLAITGTIAAGNKVYDGTDSAVLVSRTLSGVLGGDLVLLLDGPAAIQQRPTSLRPQQ